MGGPIAARYARAFGRPEFYDMAALQALFMAKHTREAKTGLFYHGWDEDKKARWADPVTGCAPEFWGRAIGWYTTAVAEILDDLPYGHKDRPALLQILGDLLDSLIRYQDAPSGLWYQVVDKGTRPDNWLETSCSCLYAYSIAKAVRKGYIDSKYLESAFKGYAGIVKRLKTDSSGHIVIDNVCVGTGIGDYAHYIARPTGANDLHGVGAFLLMCAEMSLAQ